MSPLLQHLLALTIVGLSLCYVLYQAFASLRGKRSKLGSCCAEGCTPPPVGSEKAEPTEKIIFFPSDMLRKNK